MIEAISSRPITFAVVIYTLALAPFALAIS
jgi:hypothetical protein